MVGLLSKTHLCFEDANNTLGGGEFGLDSIYVWPCCVSHGQSPLKACIWQAAQPWQDLRHTVKGTGRDSCACAKSIPVCRV